MTQQIFASVDVTCFIRKTKDWHENYKFSDDYLHFWQADLIANMWNKTFKTSYVDFRRELNNLQQENLKEINFTSVVNQYESYNKDSIVVPMDDDDWLHPDIVQILKDVNQPIMFWKFVNYTNGTIVIQNPSKEKLLFTYESNNYALINSDKDLLLNHVTADKKLKNKGFYIDSFLSIHNRTLASLSLLKPVYETFKKTGKNGLFDLYDIYKKSLITNDVPLYFIKYIDKMKKIYDNLKIRRTFL